MPKVDGRKLLTLGLKREQGWQLETPQRGSCGPDTKAQA